MTINNNEIICHDSVWSQVSPTLVKYIKPILTYKDFYWRQTRFKKERVEYTTCMLTYFKKSGEYYAYTGHIPRIVQALRKQDIKFTLTSKIRPIEFDEPHIDGKSILIRGLVQAFSKEKILFLVHTTDLVRQMMDDLKDEVDSVGEWSGKTKKKARVMVATIQSFHKVVKDWVYYFDVICTDECHHCHSIDKTYGKTLTFLAAPAKFGFTATLPATQKGRMNLAGNSAF